MELYTGLHYLSLLVCLLVLPRLPSPLKSVANNSGEVEDLVLTQVGHIPAKGLYVCFTRANRTAPDLALQYTSTYTHGNPSTHTSCTGDITYRGPELGWFCLPPCPGVITTHLLSPVFVVVTGHDRITRETTAALVESFTLSDVAPTMTQAGRGVVEVQWTGRPGSTFRVQLWHHPHAAGDDTALGEGETGERTSTNDGMDDEILLQIRDCYHGSDYNDDDDDDNDDDDNDDDDHEEDNDDFLKWMRWRRCVALHAPRIVRPAADPPVMVHTSGPRACLTDTYLYSYYVTDAPTSGFASVVVVDVTHSLVHAYHSAPTPLRGWAALPIKTVQITSEYMEADVRSKAMTVTVLNGPPGEDRASSREASEVAGSEAVVAEETDPAEEALQVVVINGHNNSEALRSQPGKCRPHLLMGDQGVVCLIRGLETLVDPEGRGPISNLLLLASHNTAASTLLVITDVHVRVRRVGPGAVLVLWDRDNTVPEFTVSVALESGSANNTITVACNKRGSDCLATFEDLAPGRYIAEVSYERQARVILRKPFIVEEKTASDGE